MGQIFISYSSADGEFAGRLADAFAEQGWSVWWDKQIPPGMDYAQVIESAVNAAQCIVVLWSRQSIGSRWVHTEAAAGADRNVVITTIIDETPNEDLPFEFRRLQAVRLGDWRAGRPHEGFERVVARIRSILNEPPGPVELPVRRPARVSWLEALTGWGSGVQRLWRAAAVLAWLAAVGVVTYASPTLQPAWFGAAAGLVVLGAGLLFLGRRPA
jgi:hypothetical protein